MSRHEHRKRTNINDPEALDPENPRLTVNNSHRIVPNAHLARASRMEDSHDGIADDIQNLPVGVVLAPWVVFLPEDNRGHGLAAEGRTDAPVSGNGYLLVCFCC